MTVRIDKSTKDTLEKIAISERRSKSFLAAEAIREYVAMQERQDELVRKAMSAADQGQVVDHDEVEKWVGSWGTDNELPMPKP